MKPPKQVLKLQDLSLEPGVWIVDDEEISSVGVMPTSISHYQGLSRGFSNLSGILSLTSCGTSDQLRMADLPASDEKRVRRAALLLQQRLILRQWLTNHCLSHTYSRLSSIDVTTLEDIYWVEDNLARHAMDLKDFPTWTAARQNLPASHHQLQALKTDLWSTVVKTSRHHDAWTWEGTLVVGASVAGLLTLAALAQPALLAPAARRALLQRVSPHNLHAPSCQVVFGWEEPGIAGDTLTFKVLCYQRGGLPYPISDADELVVTLTHRSTDRQVNCITTLGGTTEDSAHVASVSFRATLAGDYSISISIGGVLVGGSPSSTRVAPAAVCVRRTRPLPEPRVLTATAPTSTPATTSTPTTPVPEHALRVLLADAYDNTAIVTPDVLQKVSVSVTLLDPDTDEAPLPPPPRVTYDAVNERVLLWTSYPRAGLYRTNITYDNQLILDGEFDSIVLNASDAASVQRALAAPRPRLSIAAWCVGEGGDTDADGPRVRVRVRVSAQCVLVRASWPHARLQPAAPRTLCYPLTPHTKLTLEPASHARGSEAAFTVSCDAMGASALRLRARRGARDRLAAATHALLQTARDTPATKKQEELFAAVRALHPRGGGAGSGVGGTGRVTLRVQRASLLSSSLAALRRLSRADWLKPFHVVFEGESGVDWGGVSREWFSLLCRELFAPATGLFHAYRDHGPVLPRPHTDTPFKLETFSLAGRIVGKCVLESAHGAPTPVPVSLARSLLAQLQRAPVSYMHFEHDDPELFHSKIQYLLRADLDAGEGGAPELYFIDEEYDPSGTVRVHALEPRGASTRVCNSNKARYVRALARWRLRERARASTRAFLRGLRALLPAASLAAFHECELAVVVSGGAVDALGRAALPGVAAWRAGVVVRLPAPLAAWWWRALATLSADERARLLQFCTGAAHLPPAGFQDLNPRFQVVSSPRYNALPTAHTCFNQLCLPDYDSYEHLLQALLTAINEGNEGFGMV